MSTQEQKTEPQDSKPFKITDYTTTSEEAMRLSYRGPEPPEPVTCKFCGKTLYHRGILSPFEKKTVMFWDRTPERCGCQKAQEFWNEWDRRQKIKSAEAEEQKKRDEEMGRFKRLIESSGMNGRFQTRTFESFVQDTEKRKTAYQMAKKYADNFEKLRPGKDKNGRITQPEIQRNGLLITGSYGTGKTHLTAAIANQIMQEGIPVVFNTMVDMLDRIKETYRDESQESERQLMHKYSTVPLLIIDDLGSEQPTEWCATRVFQIINARYEGFMPTIITTNYGTEELIRRINPSGGDERNARKTVDRLREMCIAADMTWESWRGK